MVHAGRRYRRSFKDRTDAELWRRESDLRSAQGLEPLPPRRGSSSSQPDGRTLLDLHVSTHTAVWASQRTSYMSDVGLRVVRCLGEGRDPASVSYQDVVDLVARWRSEGLAGSTVNKRLSALGAMLSHGRKLGWVRERPEMPFQAQAPSDRRYLEDREVEAIVSHLEVNGRVAEAGAVTFLAETGLRVSEAIGILWRDVRPSHVLVWPTGSKNGKPRMVPLVASAKAVLAGIRKEGAGPFVDMSRDTLTRAFKSAADSCGVEGVVLHSLRHTCASRLVMAGVDIRRVKEWMGHRTIETTMTYAHLAPTSLMDVVGIVESRRERIPGAAGMEPDMESDGTLVDKNSTERAGVAE